MRSSSACERAWLHSPGCVRAWLLCAGQLCVRNNSERTVSACVHGCVPSSPYRSRIDRHGQPALADVPTRPGLQSHQGGPDGVSVLCSAVGSRSCHPERRWEASRKAVGGQQEGGGRSVTGSENVRRSPPRHCTRTASTPRRRI